jgi:sulfur transfer complex TusBCD TusB component (DsrH family)
MMTAQAIMGRIVNEYDEPVPFANMLVQELGTGAIADGEGNYFFSFDTEGEFGLIFSSLGYTAVRQRVVIPADTLVLDIRLQTAEVALEEITVRASAKDPAYGIIRQAIKAKARHLRAAAPYRSMIYLKAVEEIERKKAQKENAVEIATDGPVDPFAAEEQARKALVANLNMVEMQVRLNVDPPNHYKEERLAYQAYGDVSGLFVPRFAETDFNFYRNLVSLRGIADASVISPISSTAILSYKYKLEATDLEGNQIVYKIRIIPRKSGNSTLSGTIWINEGSWTINRIEVSFPSGTLRTFDEFRLEQRYALDQNTGDWNLRQQSFHYLARQGKRLTFRGTTTLSYDKYEPNYSFPEKFFGNEVAVTTREAYERDSTYWQSGRTVDLTEKEAAMVAIQDSITAVVNSKAYQDSIQDRYNKVTLLELAWEGVGLRNNAQKSHLYLGSMGELIDFSPVGGWRLGPYASYFRRFPTGQIMNVSGTANVGLKNGDLQGNFDAWYRYSPFKLGDISMSGGRSFESINQFDAYLNQLRPSNYILHDALRVRHSIELFNGLSIFTQAEISDRQPITGIETSSFLSDIVTDEEGILDFDPYQALITTNAISFTPGLKYMREPDRKINLGSKWPTFTLLHRKGWSGPLGSDIDFDLVEFAVEQDIVFGTLGNTKYRARVGQFINTRDLRFVDWKRFRQSDPILMSDPLHSFQSLDTALNTTNRYLEIYHIHHFNGALINNIPLLKKAKLKAVAGGGIMWLPEEEFRHQEIFFGAERVFKIGARRRLRVGAYGVLADSSNGRPNTAFKVSFDLIDLWKRDWSF